MRPTPIRLLALSALLGWPLAGRADTPWMPAIRLVGWSAIARLDRGGLSPEAERQLSPHDRGLALHLLWRIDDPTGSSRPPEPEPLDRWTVDVDEDPWMRPGPFGPAPEHDPRFAERRIEDVAPRETRQSRLGVPDETTPPDLLRRRAAAVGRASKALLDAGDPHARRRARLDLAEARALLRLAQGPAQEQPR